jgi:hypothetical protein
MSKIEEKRKERPIIMQEESVSAIFALRKTQTRRVMALQPGNGNTPIIGEPLYKGCVVARWGGESEFDYYDCHCPYGKTGDRLWVREAHLRYGHWVKNGTTDTGAQAWLFSPHNQEIIYTDRREKPEVLSQSQKDQTGWFLRSPLFMPRWASRLLLEITSIKAEFLQDISEADAKAEGLAFRKPNFECGYEGFWGHPNWPHVEWLSSPVKAYKKGWDSINAKRGFPWDSNPAVWATTFRIVTSE